MRIRILSLFALLMLLLAACQKELSFEQGAASTGSLQGSGGDCLPQTIQGTYRAGTALGDTNFIEVTLDVLTAGTYDIRTDTVNGYSFSASGVFTNADTAGLKVVRLIGRGTPLATGDNNFTVRYGGTDCNVIVSVGGTGGGGGGGTAAVYTLDGAGVVCGSFTPNGTYTAGTALGSTNTVTVGVNVTTLGTYTLSTSTVNGYSFSKTGTFTTLGLQTVTMNGTGTPTAAGLNLFTAAAGTTTCSFPITVLPGGGGGGGGTPAVYALQGAGGACGGFVPAGTYTAGTALGASNTVTVGVVVVTPGTYTITTNTANGYSFSKTGTFTTVGAQTVVLNGSGTPTAAGANTFTTTAPATTCTFSITVGAGGGGGGGTPAVYSAKINGVLSEFTSVDSDAEAGVTGGANFLDLLGEGVGGAFYINIESTIAIGAGTYTTATTNPLVYAAYLTPAGAEFEATQGLTGSNFTVTITSITATRVIGTFSGVMVDSAGVVRNVTEGQFSLPLP